MKVMRSFQAFALVTIMASFFVSTGRVEAQTSTVRIISVKCISATLGSDTDEIYIRTPRNGSVSYDRSPAKPYRIKKGGIWKPDYVFRFDGEFKIQLYESDRTTVGRAVQGLTANLFIDDDLIGEIKIKPNAAPGLKKLVWTGDFSEYHVQLEIK